jgi:hypothetical protein
VIGTVRDPSGAVVPGAIITSTWLETNITRTTHSNELGAYTLLALDPGTHRFTATLAGFMAAVHEPMVLEVGQTAIVDLTLGLAQVQEQVIVTTEKSVVNVRSTEVSSVVTQQQIQTLPINRRNFVGLAMINPAVLPDSTPSQGVSATSGLSFNGQRGRSNNLMVDGLDNYSGPTGGIQGPFGQEAIREYRITTASYSAEFGYASGGVVSIVTRSGTNRFEGSTFFLFRDDALNAREYFEKFNVAGRAIERDKAPFSQQQWGGVFGGPLKKNRSFLFLSFERADLRPNHFVEIDPITAVTLESNGFPVELNNVRYLERVSQLMAKVDDAWTSDHRLAIRANYSDGTSENAEPFGGIVARSSGVVQLATNWGIAAAHMDVLSPRWMNEVRVQASLGDSTNRALDPTCARGCVDESDGGPLVEIVGAATAGRARITPSHTRERRFQAVDMLSYFGSRHALKGGVDVSVTDLESALPLHFGGRFIFSPLPAIPALGLPVGISATQAFALGLPAVYIQGYGESELELPSTDVGLFAQDEWKVSSNITLSLGVRYERQLWPDRRLQVAGFHQPFQIPGDANNVAPRIALVIDPNDQHSTSVRAAYGVYYDRSISSIPGVPSIVDGQAGVRTLTLQLPQSLSAWRAPGRRLPQPTNFPSLQFALDPSFRSPFAHHVSVGVDHALNTSLLVSVYFVQIRGFDQIGTIDYNPIVPSLGPGRRPLDVAGQPGTSASVLQYTSYAQSDYRGLSLALRRPLRGRHQFAASYTWSKAEDMSSDFHSAFIPENNGLGRSNPTDTGLPLGFDPDDERGRSANDRPNRFIATGSWELPLSVGVAGIVSVASGRPYNILAGADLNGDGNGGTFPPDRARTNPTDPAASVARNSGRLPVAATVDLRVSRSFRLRARTRLEILFETYNLLNRTNFTEVNNVFGPGRFPDMPLATFGQFTAAAPARQIQLGVRANW